MVASSEKMLGVLTRWGDTLERLVAQEQQTAPQVSTSIVQLLYPYSGVWFRHVLPRRDPQDLSRLAAEHTAWAQFASSHYTALVKLYNALLKLRDMQSCSHEVAHGLGRHAELLIRAHDSFSGFWENLGSAIENLGRAFEDAPVLNYPPRSGLRMLQANYASISNAYDRRTQAIHYSIVPLGFDDGALVFNERHLDEKETTWSTTRYTAEWVDEYLIQVWQKVTTELVSVWTRLQDELVRADHPPEVPEPLLDENLHMPDGDEFRGSGMRGVAQSEVTRGKNLSPRPYWARVAPSSDEAPFPPVPPSGFRTFKNWKGRDVH